MAFENLDKAALMAKAAEHKEKTTFKKSDRCALAAFLSAGNYVSTETSNDWEVNQEEDFVCAGSDGPTSLGGWIEYSSNYSGNVGIDWDD